jgi:hypothetical protein
MSASPIWNYFQKRMYIIATSVKLNCKIFKDLAIAASIAAKYAMGVQNP